MLYFGRDHNGGGEAMKFLWLVRRDIRSNLFSTILIFTELVFLIISLCICVSLSHRVLDAAAFFGRTEGRAVTAAIGRADKQETAQAFDGIAELSVTVTYYHAKDSAGQTVYLGDYSKSAFDELGLAHTGDMTDTSKDYGDLVPAMVSRSLADKYPVGSICTFGEATILICGALTDDYLHILSADLTTEDFLMCYDSKGLLNTLELSNSANAFFIVPKGCDLLTFRRILGEIPLVKGTKEFNWKEKLGEDFDKLSGNLMIGILVLLITLIGFSANNILSAKKDLSAYRTLRCVGLSERMRARILLTRQLICLIAAAAAVLIVRSEVNKFIGDAMISWSPLLLCMGVCLAVILLSDMIVCYAIKKVRNR